MTVLAHETPINININRKILVDALDYLREYGWQQEEYGGSGHPACASGALQQAGGMVDGPEYNHFCKVNGISAQGVSFWNDRPERTVEEVEAAFERAINA